MKIKHWFLSVALIVLPVGIANSQPAKSVDVDKMAIPSKEKSATHKAVGIVKSTDPVKNTVVLAHDPVKNLDWPAMTMKFTVKDKALIDQLSPGKKVEFEFVQQGKDYMVTDVK